MSNAVLPLAMLGSMMSSIGVVGYGVRTEWKFLGKKEEPEIEFSPSPQQPTMGGVGSMIVDDFVIQGNTGEDDVTSILDNDIKAITTPAHAAVEGDNIQGLSAMPIGCSETEEDGELTAIREFEFTDTNTYSYSCSSLENPGELKFGSAGNYVTSRGNIGNLHQSQALCANNQALVGFVLDQNKTKSKLGYRFDCVNLKGPAKVRTALTRYQPYNDGVGAATGAGAATDDPTKQLNVLKGIGKIKCNEDELLQGFAVEKSGNNMRYIYRCVTPAYEAD
jgi:hypothetical protein